MRGVFISAVLFAFLVSVSGCATTAEQSLREKGLSPLTQTELEALYSGTPTVHGKTPNGGSGTATYTSDGVARFDFGKGVNTGSWRIEGGKFCVQYPNLRNGEDRCYTVYKIGDDQYQNFNPDGSLLSTFSFVKS